MMRRERDIKKRRLLTGADGKLRTGWLLTITLVAWATASLGVRFGLGALFQALFRVWNVNADTAAKAPAWARVLYSWHGSLISVLRAAAVAALCVPLRRLWKLRPAPMRLKALPPACLIGFGAIIAMGLLALAADSLRLEWPLDRPRFSAGQPVLLVSLLAVALAEELLGKGIVFDGLKARWGSLRAAVCAAILFFFINGGWSGNVVSAVNVLLMGFLTCRLYALWGLGASAGFRVGWSFAAMCALGFGGGELALYRLYHVSEGWLTGGDGGPVYGLFATAFLALALAALYRSEAGVLLKRIYHRSRDHRRVPPGSGETANPQKNRR